MQIDTKEIPFQKKKKIPTCFSDLMIGFAQRKTSKGIERVRENQGDISFLMIITLVST